MKIIITESKLNQAVIDYLNEIYDTNNIGWTYGMDDWGNEVDYAMEFYGDDYDGGDNTLFRWYSEDYWNSEEAETISSGWGDEDDNNTIKEKQLKSPLLVFEDDDVKTTLNGYFGDKWKRPFIDWFWDKFHVHIRTVE